MNSYLRNAYILAAVLVATAARANDPWTVVNLHPAGVVDPSEGYGAAIGQQVGYVRIQVGLEHNRHASLWTGSAASWVDLNPSWSYISEALGARGGQQVGYSFGPDGVTRASLWTGSAASWVDLTPGTQDAIAYGVSGGQQVGSVGRRASLWSGTAASWTSLHPGEGDPVGPFNFFASSVAYGVGDGQQVGYVVFSSVQHASLWNGSAASWVNLDPAGAIRSVAYGVSGGQQVGIVVLSDRRVRASLWTGSASSWVDLSPPGTDGSEALAVDGGMQVGDVRGPAGGPPHASLWLGTAASWVDLHAYLPSNFTESYARGIVHSPTTGTYIVGSAYNTLSHRHEAMIWTLPPAILDSDNDGLSDADEALYGTNPNDSDTDHDGLLDGTEVEMAQGSGCPSPTDSDSDDDGLSDGAEVALGTSPCNPDTDGDGVNDRNDPTPLVPGVPGSYIESGLRDLSHNVLALSLSVFDAPNSNAGAGRRNSMSNKLTTAANKVASGDRYGAIDELTNLLQKLDGDPSPPDWMINGTPKQTLYEDISLMIALLRIP